MLFAGLLLYLFLDIVRPQDFVPGLMGLPLIFGLMVVLLIGWVLSGERKKLYQSPVDMYMVLFAISMVLSTFTLNWLTYTYETFVASAKSLLVYFFIINILSNERQFVIATWSLVLFMSIIALMGILQSCGIDITGQGMGWSADKKVWQIRLTGFFDNPNDIAYSVALVVPFAIKFYSIYQSMLVKILSVILLLISLTCIYLTYSRGGYLALIFLVVSYLYFNTTKTRARKLLFIVGAIILALSIKVFPMLSSSLDYRNDASSMGRVEAWGTGFELLKQHPIIGVGREQFIEYHERDSHNSYVRAGAELGAFGLFVWLSVLYFSFQQLIRISQNPALQKWRQYSVPYLAYLGSYMVGSVFSTRTYDHTYFLVVAMGSAMWRNVWDQGEPPKYVVTSRDLIKIFGLMVLILIIWKLFCVYTW